MNSQTLLLIVGLINIFGLNNSSDQVLTPVPNNNFLNDKSSNGLVKELLGGHNEFSGSSLVRMLAEVDPNKLEEVIDLLVALVQETEDDRNKLITEAENADSTLKTAITRHEEAVSAEEEAEGQKNQAQGANVTAHKNLEDLKPDLDNEILVLEQVIEDLQMIDGWELIATVDGTETLNTEFWNKICVSIRAINDADTVYVRMGQVKDYYKPINDISFCDFLMTKQFTWSSTLDGSYQVPEYNANSDYFGGSENDWPKSIDGRSYISFWGTNAGHPGGCCHASSTIYGGSPDDSSWGQPFTMYLSN